MTNWLSNAVARIRKHPLIVALALLMAAVSALASFTDAVTVLAKLVAKPGPEAARAQLATLGIPFTPAALQESARNRDHEAVKLLLRAGMGADAVAERDGEPQGMPALIHAAINGDLAMLETLLAANADVDGVSEGKTALAEAAGRGDRASVEMLLAAKADVNVEDGVAAQAAAYRGHIDVLLRLLEEGPSEKTFQESTISAAAGLQHDVVRLLAARMADPEEASSRALWHMSGASGYSDEDVVAINRLLLELGADPNTTQSEGETPLMRAASDRRPEVVAGLLAGGANVNARCTCPQLDHGDWTPLGLAITFSDLDTVERLIAAGADPNVRYREGDTPLILAARLPNVDMVRALLKAGADVNARGKDGDSALDIASRGYRWFGETVQRPDIVELLSTYQAVPR
jgi:ankyrin repeat protein